MKLNDYYKRLRQGQTVRDGKDPGQARADGKFVELSDEELKNVTGGLAAKTGQGSVWELCSK